MRAIADGVPELDEFFKVTLVSADEGGRVVDPREVTISIQSNEDPRGLIQFDEYPQRDRHRRGRLVECEVGRPSSNEVFCSLLFASLVHLHHLYLDQFVHLYNRETVVLRDLR